MANKRIGIFAALVLVAVAVAIASSGSVAQGFHNRVSKVVTNIGVNNTRTDVIDAPPGTTIAGFSRSGVQSSLGGQEISATISADGTKLTVVSDSGGRTGTRFIPPIHTHSDTAVLRWTQDFGQVAKIGSCS